MSAGVFTFFDGGIKNVHSSWRSSIASFNYLVSSIWGPLFVHCGHIAALGSRTYCVHRRTEKRGSVLQVRLRQGHSSSKNARTAGGATASLPADLGRDRRVRAAVCDRGEQCGRACGLRWCRGSRREWVSLGSVPEGNVKQPNGRVWWFAREQFAFRARSGCGGDCCCWRGARWAPAVAWLSLFGSCTFIFRSSLCSLCANSIHHFDRQPG
jgi:hypothetical protein